MKKLVLAAFALMIFASLSFSQWPAAPNGVLITKDVDHDNTGTLTGTGTFKLDVAIPLTLTTINGSVDLGSFVQSATPYTLSSDLLKWKVEADKRYTFYIKIYQKEQNETDGNKIETAWEWNDGTPSSGPLVNPDWLNGRSLSCYNHDGWCEITCQVTKVYANKPTTAVGGPEVFEQKIEVAYKF